VSIALIVYFGLEMVKFELKNLDENLFSQKMRDVFKSLVDVYVSYPQKDTKDGFLKSIPSNYGYVFFWFGFLDEEALAKYYKDYVSKDKLREIEEAKKKRRREFEEAGIREGYFSLSDHIRDDLFPIVYDHPDIIGQGFAEVYLATVFNPEFKEVSIDRAISSLKRQVKKLEKINDFADKVFKRPRQIEGVEDIEINYETIKFVDSKASEEEIGALIFEDEEIFEDENYQHIFRREGWEICLRIIFDGDDTLKEVVERIDKIISPLKGVIDKMVRYESSFSPF